MEKKLKSFKDLAPAFAAANLPCPICHGVEGCTHTDKERAHAAQYIPPEPQGEIK